jgi:hypothetical protein
MAAPSYKRWKLIFILAFFVLAVMGLLALTLTGERPCPLAVRFDRLIDSFGVFIVTNQSDTSLRFRPITESKASGSWPIYPGGTVLPHYTSPDSGSYDIAAHQSRELCAYLPTAGTPVRVSIACEEPWTALERRRWSVSVWFHDHNLPAVGRFISEGKPAHLILSSEIHK